MAKKSGQECPSSRLYLELRPGEGSPDVPDLFQGEVERRASLQAARALLPLVLDGGDLGHLLLAVRRLVLLYHKYNLLYRNLVALPRQN